MRAVVTRVKNASVVINEQVNGQIGTGFLVLLGVGPNDTEVTADKLADKICNLRVFEDENEKMNLNLEQVGGSLLVVSQFTLYADCRKGRRPSFTDAGNPDWARPMFDYFVKMVDESCAVSVSSGIFGADMAVRLCNWGPVTIWLDSANLFAS